MALATEVLTGPTYDYCSVHNVIHYKTHMLMVYAVKYFRWDMNSHLKL